MCCAGVCCAGVCCAVQDSLNEQDMSPECKTEVMKDQNRMAQVGLGCRPTGQCRGLVPYLLTHLLTYLHGSVKRSTHCRSKSAQGA
jgi:hypothetical protein